MLWRMTPRKAAVFALLALAAIGCNSECAELSLDECADSKGCGVLSAGKIIEGCASKWIPVACTSSRDCDGSVTVARDPKGDEWLFGSTCVPDGWMTLPTGGDTPQCE